jgi:hypothetical protein
MNDTAVATKVSRIARVLAWRKKNPEEFQKRRTEGLRNSPKAVAAARRVAKEYKKANWEKLSKQARFQKGPEHIRSEEWKLKSPDNVIYTFINLADFVRNNAELFNPEDLACKTLDKMASCRAYAGLAMLRPTNAKTASSWKGWVWVT